MDRVTFFVLGLVVAALLGAIVPQSPRQGFTGAAQVTLPSGAEPGPVCTLGELFLDTDETNDGQCTTTLDNAICACVAANTWADTKGL